MIGISEDMYVILRNDFTMRFIANTFDLKIFVGWLYFRFGFVAEVEKLYELRK